MSDRPNNSPPIYRATVDEFTEFTDKAIPASPAAGKDPLSLRRIDHVRFFVGNARQSAYFYRNAFGFDVVAYAGLETRSRQEAGYVLRQGHITFVLASPLGPDHPENRRLVQHGDGVQDIAFEVDDVAETYKAVTGR